MLLPNAESLSEEAELTLENGEFPEITLWMGICGLILLLHSRGQSEVRAKLNEDSGKEDYLHYK